MPGRLAGQGLRGVHPLLEVSQPAFRRLHPTQRVSLLQERVRPQQPVQQRGPHQARNELAAWNLSSNSNLRSKL